MKNFGLNESQLDQLKEAFSLFDSDKDGKIAKNELKVLLQSMGQSPSETDLRDMIDQVDATGDDSISFVEFVAFMKRISLMCQLAEAPRDDSSLADEINSHSINLFRRIQNEQTGRICAEKLASLLRDSAGALEPSMTNIDIERMCEEASEEVEGGIDLKGKSHHDANLDFCFLIYLYISCF